jgi:hypothetical protein
MTHVQDGDDRKHQPIRDSRQQEEPSRVEARSERDGGDVRYTGDRSPQRGFPDGLVFVWVDDVSVNEPRCSFALRDVYGFRFPFSSYS